jgi:hypothetical protein
MDVAALLAELYGRIPPLVHAAVADLDGVRLHRAPAPGTNSIGWLIWHLTRVEDHHVAELTDTEQLWVTGDWAGRCGLRPDPADIGYGHSPEQVTAVRPDGPQVLLDYHDAVDGRTRDLLGRLTAEDLDRIVDRRWDPPVTMGVRLVSIADDCLQHVGQAAYLRGLFDRSS